MIKPKMGRLISTLYRKNQSYLAVALKPLHISTAEYPILLNLYTEDNLTQEQLTARSYMDKSSVTRAVKALEYKGFVEKREDPRDRRCNRITLTEKGRSIELAISQVINHWNDTLLLDMNKEEQEKAYALLLQMQENLEKERL